MVILMTKYDQDIDFLRTFKLKLNAIAADGAYYKFDRQICDNFALFVNNAVDSYHEMIISRLDYVEDIINATYNAINRTNNVDVKCRILTLGIVDINRHISDIMIDVALL